MARRAIFMDLLEQELDGQRDARVLDVGCGAGGMLGPLERFGEVWGVDSSEQLLAECRRRGFEQVCHASAGRLPVQDGSVDVLTLFDTLEHIADDVDAPARRWQAGLLAEALLGTLVVWLTYEISRRLWGRRIALACGLVAALWPPLVMVGSSLMSEPLFIALELAAVLAALCHRDSRHRLRWALASGVLCGAAALARGNGIALVVALAFLVWTQRPRLSARALRAPLALVAAALLAILPWTIRNATVLHRLVPVTSEAGYALAGTYNRYAAAARRFPDAWVPPVPEERSALARDPHLNEAALSDRLLRDAFSYIGRYPGYVAGVLYHNTLRTLDLTGTSFERFAARYEVYPGWLVALSVDAFAVALVLALGALATGAGGLVGRRRRCGACRWWCWRRSSSSTAAPATAPPPTRL